LHVSQIKKNSKKNIFYPIQIDGYKEFFETNYLDKWQKTVCLCKKTNDLQILIFSLQKQEQHYRFLKTNFLKIKI
jgi:hypothetical protein